MNKTLLVIGSGPGIGFATARRFAQEGYDIVLSSRNTQNLQAQALQLAPFSTRVSLLQADASDATQMHALVTELSQNRRLTVLYNAGVLRYDESGNLRSLALSHHTIEELQSDIAINLTNALIAVRAAELGMTGRGEGSIFITGGGFGVEPSPDFLPISVGKAGIRAIAKAMFEPLKEKGIHIGTVTVSQLVSPGSQASHEIANLFWQMESAPKDAWDWEKVYG